MGNNTPHLNANSPTVGNVVRWQQVVRTQNISCESSYRSATKTFFFPYKNPSCHHGSLWPDCCEWKFLLLTFLFQSQQLCLCEGSMDVKRAVGSSRLMFPQCDGGSVLILTFSQLRVFQVSDVHGWLMWKWFHTISTTRRSGYLQAGNRTYVCLRPCGSLRRKHLLSLQCFTNTSLCVCPQSLF